MFITDYSIRGVIAPLESCILPIKFADGSVSVARFGRRPELSSWQQTPAVPVTLFDRRAKPAYGSVEQRRPRGTIAFRPQALDRPPNFLLVYNLTRFKNSLTQLP